MFTPSAPSPLVAPRNLAPQAESNECAPRRFVCAACVTPLLRLRCPTAKARTDAFRSERICSIRGKAKRANPLLQKRNASYEHDRKHNRRRMHYPTGSSDRFNRQTNQISIPTTGVENCFIAGVPDTRPTSDVRYAGASGGILEDAHRSTSILQS